MRAPLTAPGSQVDFGIETWSCHGRRIMTQDNISCHLVHRLTPTPLRSFRVAARRRIEGRILDSRLAGATRGEWVGGADVAGLSAPHLATLGHRVGTARFAATRDERELGGPEEK